MTKKAYNYIPLDRIPYSGYVNVYGVVMSIEKKRGFEKVVIKDEVGHVVIIPDVSLLEHLEVGFILRLHRSMISTPTKLLYKPHIRGNSAAVWDLSTTFIPKFHTSSTYTFEDHDKTRVTKLRQLSSEHLSECQNSSDFDLTESYKKKIISLVLNLSFESNENYTLTQKTALDSVTVSSAKTLSSFNELNSSYLSGKNFFNFVAFVAEIFKVGQVVYVRVFDGSKAPIAPSLYKVKSNEVVLVKTMPEKDIIEKASDFLFDIACFGGHAAAALELEIGNIAVFANARVYTRKMGDKVICLHEGENHRRVAASVGNYECELISSLKQRCADVLSDLYAYSQSQSSQRFTQTQPFLYNESSLNLSNFDIPEEADVTGSLRKRKNDENSFTVAPPNKRFIVTSVEFPTDDLLDLPAAASTHTNDLTQNLENDFHVGSIEPVLLTENQLEHYDGLPVHSNDHHVSPQSQRALNPTDVDNPDHEAVEIVEQLDFVTTHDTSDADENSRDVAVINVLNDLIDSLSEAENSELGVRASTEQLTLETLNQPIEKNEDDISAELVEACGVIALYRTITHQIEKLFDVDNDTKGTLEEEIELVLKIEPDSPCVMENFMIVDNYHFMNQSFYAHCVIFTGNCDVCLNEFRVDRKASIGCPFCLDKSQTNQLKIGIRILFPIRKDFLIGLSREQIMHAYPTPSLDPEKVTLAFHAAEEDYARWCSDVQVIATSVVGTYRIRPNYCRVITKSPTIIFVEDCDMEKKF